MVREWAFLTQSSPQTQVWRQRQWCNEGVWADTPTKVFLQTTHTHMISPPMAQHANTERRAIPDDNHISEFPVISLACSQRRPFTLRPCKNPDCCFLKRAARVCEPHKSEMQGRAVWFVCVSVCVCMRDFCACYFCVCVSAHWCSFLLSICSYLHVCELTFKGRLPLRASWGNIN